jgi:hypothetical protein
MTDRIEALGPAERIIATVIGHADHMVHNRPGLVVEDRSAPGGVTWAPVTHRVQDGAKIVYKLQKQGRKSVEVKAGALSDDGTIRDGNRVVGRYQPAGLFPEIAAHLYRQVAEVWRLDNEFAARWASYAFAQEHKDLKVVLAAFLLVQDRKGEPVKEDGKILFADEDYRNVGEAMCLLRRADGRDLNPKLLLRVGELLELDAVAAINRELGFGASARNAALGRYPKVVEKWLRYREQNPKMLAGLVKAGFRTTVIRLAQKVGYKPSGPEFFRTLRWKQKQATDGRRTIAIGEAVEAAESWEGLGEAEVCARIVETAPDYKRLVGLLPKTVGLTRAVMAAAIEAGSLSDTDLILLTPTLEDLGLLSIAEIKTRWVEATEKAENQRAANIAARVRTAAVKETLEAAADAAVKKAAAEVERGLRVYVIVDISGSMQGAIERAKVYLTKFLQGFPLERTHVAVFNTTGREVVMKHASAAGVEHAFKPFAAGGGTDYGAGVKALAHHALRKDEDALYVFVGDQQASTFASAFGPVAPVAFGMLHIGAGHDNCVEMTAAALGIPCFRIDEATFQDPYAVTRTIRNLIASTPVQAAVGQRKALVPTILETKLLEKPVWA